MPYRKSDKIIAGEEKRRDTMIAATLQLIAKHGSTNFSTLTIARRAKLSEGLVYKYFADKDELLAVAVGEMLKSHLTILQDDGALPHVLRLWARELAEEYKLMSVIGTIEGYKLPIKNELRRKLREAGATSGSLECAVLYGAVLEAAGSLTHQNETALVASLMRAVGLRVPA